MAKPTNPVQLGTIGAAHGIRGELRVRPFTEDPMALGSYGPLYTDSGRSLEVVTIRPAKEVVIIKFEGVSDRNAAEALKGQALFVDRSALPEDLEEEEFYHADLVGMLVLDETDENLGRVVAVHNFGAGDLLEIKPQAGRTLMVPFTREAVPDVDLSEGMIRIDSMAAGLLRDGVDDDSPESSQHHDRAARPRGPKSAGGDL